MPGIYKINDVVRGPGNHIDFAKIAAFGVIVPADDGTVEHPLTAVGGERERERAKCVCVEREGGLKNKVCVCVCACVCVCV